MEIRRMTKEDIEALARLEERCFSQPWSAHTLEAQLDNPNAVFLIAQEAGTLMGYAGMHRVLDEGYINNVAVDSQFRRRGVGASLVEALFQYGREEKLCFLTLEVRASNQPAIQLYKKMGFGQVGIRKEFYANPCEDALLMTAFLHVDTARPAVSGEV